MSSFGENLRREREMRGVTLEEISAATKISVRFLQCVEEEDFSKLPGGIFTRSFIRSYARYLGLDEEALLAEFQLVAKADKGETAAPRLYAARPISVQETRAWWKPVAVLVVAAAFLAAGYSLWRYSRHTIDGLPAAARATSTTTPKSEPTAPSAAQPLISASGSVTGSSNSATSATAAAPNPAPTAASQTTPAAGLNAPNPGTPAPAGSAGGVQQGGLVLQIAATERSWVAVDADGKTILQGILSSNDVKTLHAQKSFDVLTGNAQGIILTLNGQTLQPLGREGEVKSIHLTRADLKNPNP